MKTTIIKESEVQRSWRVVDAAGKPVGRLAVEIVRALRGKDLPTYTPNADMGDFIIVINAEKAVLTGRKEEQKLYKRYSGYNSGLKETPAGLMRQTHPDRLIRSAVKGMLPKNHLARRMMPRLKIYAGSDHPHAAQKPKLWQVAI
jgi:large subunit ribosomal protein L13